MPSAEPHHIAKEAGGTKRFTVAAIDFLFAEGYVTKSEHHYPRYTSVRPYREADDPMAKTGSDGLEEHSQRHMEASSEERTNESGKG